MGGEKSPDYKTEAAGAKEVHPVAEAGERKVPKVPALQNSQAMRVLPSDRNIQKGRLKHHKNHTYAEWKPIGMQIPEQRWSRPSTFTTAAPALGSSLVLSNGSELQQSFKKG